MSPRLDSNSRTRRPPSKPALAVSQYVFARSGRHACSRCLRDSADRAIHILGDTAEWSPDSCKDPSNRPPILGTIVSFWLRTDAHQVGSENRIARPISAACSAWSECPGLDSREQILGFHTNS